MPWTAQEAHGFTHKAKSPKKKRQWSKVANSMLKRGASEGSAVRAANAAVGDQFWDGDHFLRTKFWDWADIRYRKIIRRGASGKEEGTFEEEMDDKKLNDDEGDDAYKEANPEPSYRCGECDGKGFVHGRRCPACGGTGFIKESEKMRRESAFNNTNQPKKKDSADPPASRVAVPRFEVLR